MKKILWLVMWCGVGSGALGQLPVISKSSVENRARIISQLPADPEKAEAVEYARKYGLAIRRTDRNGRVIEIQRIENGRHPLYNETQNINAARTVSTDKLWEGNVGGFHLRGKNILVAVWDGGKIRTTHVEFGSRAYSLDSGLEIVGHTTHVAGTIGAKGIDSLATGMAGQCFIEGYDWDNDAVEMRQAAGDGLLLSNHSYGFIHGFSFNEDERRWEWYGDINVDEKEDYSFGFYSRYSREWDNVAYDHPYYLIVKSSGNDRLEGPAPGTPHYVLDGDWKLSYATRNLDGAPDGFDCIGTRATAKNILTVGAVGDLVHGFKDPDSVKLADFSTFGPTDDGRIKPDIVGNGTALYSCYHESDHDYHTLSGTSMAAPNVAGSLALLQELHFRMYGTYMKSSTLKGLVLHSADDAGKPGPDYKFGWGLLNSRAAASLIYHLPSHLVEDSISDQSECRYHFYAPGDSGIKITLCWTDPRGPLLPASLDPTTLILVNDLDMRLIKQSDSMVLEPFILDPEDPDAPARTGDNFRDNMEQIRLSDSEKGYYELVITHKGSLMNDLQHFSLVVEGLGITYLAEDTTYLDQNNGFLQVTNAPEYPGHRNFVWLVEPENQEPVTFQFDTFHTSILDTVYIYDGPDKEFPLLGKYSGILNNPDTMLFSSAGSLFIEFRSGSDGGYQGFSARYCTRPPEETPKIKGAEYPCSGSDEVYFFDPVPESEYRWVFSDNISDSAHITFNSVLVRIPDHVFTLTVIPENRCGIGMPSSHNVTPLTSPPPEIQVITGDTVPCTNVPNLYTVENEPANTYWWTLPKGWTGRSDSASIWVTPLKEPGSIIVIPTNSCGEAEKTEVMVNPMTVPAIPDIENEKINPCENELTQFSIVQEPGESYLWRAEKGWEIQGPDSLSEVSVLVGSGSSGRMFVTSANRCGETLGSRNFILSPAPTTPYLRKQPSPVEGMEELFVLNYQDYSQVNWFRNDSLYEGYHESSLILHRNGVYSIDVITEDGCIATMESDQKAKIDEKSLLYSINTASEGLIRIQNDDAKTARVRVYDLTGRIVFSDEVQPGSNQYHTTRRGLLIFRIEGNNVQKTQMVFVY